MVEESGLEVLHTEQITKRHDFVSWAQRQSVDEKVLAKLEDQLINAPSAAAEWMQVEQPGTPQATFVNHHIILLARK